MKIKTLFLVSLCGLTAALSAGTAHATITTYSDRATFISLLQPGYFEDAFNGVTSGSISGPAVTRTDGVFSVTYSATPDGLYSVVGGLSTSNAQNDLDASLGAGIYAVGGYFFLTDENGIAQPFPGIVVRAFASNGIDPDSHAPAASNSATNFFGWISSAPLTGVTFNSGGGSPTHWNTLDDVFVGAAKPISSSVPEPGTLALFALGVAGLVCRRHKPAASVMS